MYDLHNLGWQSFQQLCQTIVREILGQTVESYLDSHDGGRDGGFTGEWYATGSEDLSGPFVIQCKFTSAARGTLSASGLSDEVEKARRLVDQGLCESYVLMTNAGITGTAAGNIKDCFEAVGVQHFRILGSTWINQQIGENKRLRMLVPRVYGLGDLSQILDARAYDQARNILESMREDLAKVVVTDAYRRAAEAIDKHGFVLLVGEPASGKTTIASLLAMAALDQWDASILKLYDPSEVAKRWNPDEPSQFFWLDDAFGVTQYEDSLAQGWNHVLPIRHMLRTGAKIVMTSRDYIYARARHRLKASELPLLDENQVVINVHELSNEEKRQILYNHVKLGNQPRAFRTKIKPHLESVARHPGFIPETARRLADPFFTRNLFMNDYHIGQFVERREQLLQEIIQGLDPDSKAALALVFMRNGRLESPVILQASETQALDRLGSNLGGCVTALDTLKGSLVLFSRVSGDPVWQFKHPTIGDAYAAILVQNPEYIGIFIQGSDPERLTNQVTCGEVGIENAIVVPGSLFPLVLAKLDEMPRSEAYKSEVLATYSAKWSLLAFLGRRSSKEFIELYLKRNPHLLNQVSHPGLMLNSVPEVGLAKRLNDFGLLPDDHRKRFVETVSNYALEGMDAGALDDDEIRTLFTDDEYNNLVQQVRTELLPRLDDVRREWQSNLPHGEPPEQYLQPLFDFFNSLKAQFRDDQKTVEAIDIEVSELDVWIAENTEEETEMSPQRLDQIEFQEVMGGMRSVFDDIDSDDEYESH